MARGVFLPDGEDPDSFIEKNGREAFAKEIKDAGDLFIQLLDEKLRSFSGKTHEKMEALAWSVKILAHLDPQSPLFAVYLPEVDSRLRLGLPAIKQELRKAYGGKKTKSYAAQIEPEAPQAPKVIEKVKISYKRSDLEFIMFNLLLESSSMRGLLIEEDFEFSDPGTNFLWGVVKARHRQNPNESGSLEAHLVNYCSNPNALTLTLERPYSHLNHEKKLEVFNDCFQSVKKKQLGAQAKLLTKKIRQDAADEELKQFMELQRQKRKILKV